MSATKIILSLTAALSLAACVDGGNSVARLDTLSASCPGSPHMQTMAGLPMRCGPQTAAPFTLQ